MDMLMTKTSLAVWATAQRVASKKPIISTRPKMSSGPRSATSIDASLPPWRKIFRDPVWMKTTLEPIEETLVVLREAT